jgi:hypothetical protein
MSGTFPHATADRKPGMEVDYVEEFKSTGGTHNTHVEGNALLISKDGTIRKIPVPSNNPNDPLNFRPWEKAGLIFCCCWFSIMGLAIASGLGAILNVFFEIYIPQGYTPDQVVFLITMPSLCIGLGKSYHSHSFHHPVLA